MRGRLVRAFGKVFGDDLGGRFEQAIRERGVEYALVGDVAADVHERHAHRFLAQRRHVESHAQGFFEAVAMREHRTCALRIKARVIGGHAVAKIAAHDQHAIEALDLEAHLELEIAILVALLRALAGLENAARGLQDMRGDRCGQQRVQRAAGDFLFAGVQPAHRVAAYTGKDDSVAAHDQRQVGKGFRNLAVHALLASGC